MVRTQNNIHNLRLYRVLTIIYSYCILFLLESEETYVGQISSRNFHIGIAYINIIRNLLAIYKVISD